MFESLEMAPPDPILGLSEAFRADPNPDKINLTVGVYKDRAGNTPVLSSVKKAERRILDTETSKGYLPIDGLPEQAAAVQSLIFGEGHEAIVSGRAISAQTPGGSGALRIAADLLRQLGKTKIWLSAPTWPNHPGIFGAAGIEASAYPYYDAETKSLDFEAMCSALEGVGEGEVVLLHGCCHNPTGMDPTIEQWRALADLAKSRGFLPFFDFAYQGFGDGLAEDAQGLRAFCHEGCELMVASSYSKNFGLYNERVGALTIVARNPEAAEATRSHVKKTIRVNYSNPPAHGGKIVAAILGDPELRAEWEGEVAAMRDRIRSMRTLFVETLKAKGVQQDFSFLTRQKGMFSFSGLDKERVERLREEFSIYMVGSGRINVAGITEDNVERLCEGVAAVL